MPAHSNAYPWPSHYGHFRFFEQRMSAHQRVTAVRNRGGGVYELTLTGGAKFKVFICECYCFGEAEYVEVIGKLGPLDAIVISSAWCSYTDDAKLAARTAETGVFTIAEVMGALNKPEPWSHLTREQRERYAEARLI
ncbi:MAG: hypothetical protein EOP84_00665 [Verrucomicrobiaceae bacterium]|nr:MAG: hypothetical protein EOP84_00665 [Verrucomicrobiaceae bacterium]